MRNNQITLFGESGFAVSVLGLGASIGSIRVPTTAGDVDVVLTYDDLSAYAQDSYFLGKTVGRFANRIRGGRFTLSGVDYSLDINELERGNCLHGGVAGLHSVEWRLHHDEAARKVVCHYISEHGEQGFPGELELSVIYQIVDGRSLSVEFNATCDRETVLNLANHAYFNLNTTESKVDNHEVRLHCDAYTPVDDALIPTGRIAGVTDTVFDLRRSSTIGAAVFDTNFVVAGEAGCLRPAAEIYSPDSGIKLGIATTQPGLQFYTGDHLGVPFRPRAGFCFEAQNFPDAPNQPTFPSARVAPDRPYREQTVYRFS